MQKIGIPVLNGLGALSNLLQTQNLLWEGLDSGTEASEWGVGKWSPWRCWSAQLLEEREDHYFWHSVCDTDAKSYGNCNLKKVLEGAARRKKVQGGVSQVASRLIGWEIHSGFRRIPQLFRFQTFFLPEFWFGFCFSDRKTCSCQFETHSQCLKILSHHQLFQILVPEKVPAIYYFACHNYIYSFSK